MTTARQLVVLRAIARRTKALGFPPSLRELGRALRLSSTNGVHQHLTRLELQGLVTRRAKVARSLVLTPAAEQLLAVTQ